ncbi:MAG: beta-lactamase regulating signal transducer with metallopeptidase domain [Akkermansiaceae bacterium]|jgi:beta-lactamase regulating signal transducer with metallopeptidase domain
MIVELINQHADRFSQIGLHFLWQGTAIAILAAIISRFLITNPRHRATLYFGALFLCVPITLMNLSSPPPEPIATPALIPPTDFETTIPTAPLAVGPLEIAPPAPSPLPLSFWIAGIYFTGLLLMMGRVVLGYHCCSKIRRHGKAIKDGPWHAALTQAVSKMKLRSKPLMIWSEKVTSPVVTGIFRPMIVLPISLMSGLPKDQAVAILSHELAHLRRFDHLIVVFQRLLEALFFFHPAVWFLSRRLDQEREKACDDLVVQAINNRADYAEALVNLGSNHQPTLALAAAKNPHLKDRIFRILNHPQPTTVRVNRGGWLTIAAAIGALGFFSLSPAHSEEKEVVEAEESEEVETGVKIILKKLETRIPDINFQNVTLVGAVKFLRTRSIELDLTSKEHQKGINWVVRKRPYDTSIVKIDRLVGKNLTFREVLGTVCEKTNTRYKVSKFAITILPQLAPGEEDTWIIQRRWKTLPDFPALITATGIGSRSKPIDEHLKALGVEFPKGASASYLLSSTSLIVRNTPKNLEKIDAIVKATSDPKTAKEQRARANSTEAERLASAAYDKLLTQRTWMTTPDFLDRIALTKGSRPSSLYDCLGIHGVTFLGNSAASFLENGTLIARNTEENLDLIDALVNVPLTVVLQYLCQATKTRYVVEGRLVSILPIEDLPKPADEPTKPKTSKLIMPPKEGANAIVQKLQIRIPNIKLVQSTLEEAIEFLRIRSIELDLEPDPNKKGINIVLRHPKGSDQDPNSLMIDRLTAQNFTFMEALQAICLKTKMKFRVDEFAITLFPVADGELGKRLWRVSDNLVKLIAADGAATDPKSIKGHLEAKGVTFEGSASASFQTRGPNRGYPILLVINTPKNFELVDRIVKSVAKPMKVNKEADEKREIGPVAGTLEDLQKIIIPMIRLNGSTLYEATEFLRIRALELDPKKKGLNINTFGIDHKRLNSETINLSLDNVPLVTAIQNLCQVTGTRYTLEGRNISIYPANDPPKHPALVPNVETEEEKAAKAAWQKKIEPLKKIMIPEIRLEEATLVEAVAFLRLQSRQHDPNKKGVNINISDDGNKLAQAKVINLHLKNVPLNVALKYVCSASKTRYSIEHGNVLIVPIKE